MGSSSCDACQLGFFCTKDGVGSYPCPAGTRQIIDSYNNFVCVDCVAGTFNPTTGISDEECTSCLAGHYCPSRSSASVPCSLMHYQDETGAPSCKLCEPGYFTDQVGQTSCKQCEEGFSCDSSGTIAPCPPGTYQTKDELGWHICSLCPPGQYNKEERSTSCKVCNPGYYCPEGSSSQTECLSGTVQPLAAQSNSSSCIKCSFGTYCPSGTLVEIDCIEGTFQNLVQYESQERGYDSPSSCETCPQGHMCYPGSQLPVLCEEGTYQNYRGKNFCFDCPPGLYCQRGATNGVACPSGEFVNGTVCAACQSGHYCTFKSTSMTPCAPGTYRYESHAAARSDCQSCPVGHFCPIKSTNPTKCPEGTFLPTERAKSIEECKFCGEGKYCPSSENITSVEEQPCPAGTFNSNLGGQTIEDCEICPKGFFCGESCKEPVKCPSKFYSLVTGQTSFGSCKKLDNLIQCEEDHILKDCSCVRTFEGAVFADGNHTCTKIDVCNERHNICLGNAICNLNPLEWQPYCTCPVGYQLDQISKTICLDIDECANSLLNTCAHKCLNNDGSYSCECDIGFSTTDDARSCTKVVIELNDFSMDENSDGSEKNTAVVEKSEVAAKELNEKVALVLAQSETALKEVDEVEINDMASAQDATLKVATVLESFQVVTAASHVKESADSDTFAERLMKSEIKKQYENSGANEKAIETKKLVESAVSKTLALLDTQPEGTQIGNSTDGMVFMKMGSKKLRSGAPVSISSFTLDGNHDGTIMVSKVNVFALDDDATDEPVLGLQTPDGDNPLSFTVQNSKPPSLVSKKLVNNEFASIKIEILKVSDFFVTIKSDILSMIVYLNYGSPPNPEFFVHEFKLALPATTHDDVNIPALTIAKCNSVDVTGTHCAEATGEQYGLRLPKVEIENCMTNANSAKCFLFLGVMVTDLNAVEPTDVNITYTTASCQILNGDDENWDYDSCKIDPFKTTTEVTSCDCGETSADIKVSTRVFTPPSTIDFSSVFENVCMDCAMPIIQFVILMLGVWAAMCIWSRRNDEKDLTQLKLIDLRSYHNRYNLVQQDYLIVVRTSTHTTIGMKNPQTGYISFHIKSTYAASDLERFLHGAFIHRSYSLLLPDNVHFTPGSEQAFLIRSNAPLEQAHRVQLWANFEGMDISWRPESVKVYIPRSEATTGIPAFGSIKKQFEKVNQFKISGKIGLSEETEILTAPSKKLLKQLNMAPKVNMSANPITILKKNFHIENIKLAIFSYSPWEFCNRSAKTMIVHATLAVASVANMMFYQTPKTTPIEIGPIQLDPQSYLVNMYVTLLTVTTTLVFAYVFQNTLPSSLQGASGADNFNVGRSRWMRPLAYILCTFVILVSYFFTILYGLQLTKVPVKNWVGSQVIGIITDFLAGPVLIVLLKGYLSYFFGYKSKRQAKYFIHDPSGLKHDSFEVSIAKITQKPSEINDARATKAARIDKKFKKSLHQTFRSIISTLVTTAVYFILSRSFIADEKFEVDRNLRSRFRSDFTENIATVGEIWSVIDDFKAVNFANTSYDGKLLSAFERRKASDHISLRVGPARLLQTRKQGGNYAPKWVPRSIEDMKDYEKESPYLVPWISSASEVPEDFIEQIFNSVTNHRYEAELGVDLDSCELIIEELKNSAWIDNSTSFLMIEQTYFNGNINIFAQLRLTFERTPGGGYTPTLSINQFVYTHGSQSNLYFAAYCIFAIQFITKLISMLRRIYNRKLDKKLLANAIFVIMDTLMTYFFISRLLVTTEAVRIYSINPRQRPPFDQVFILQTYCSSTIALALFFNSFHVIFVLTGLNMVKIYFDVIRKIVRKSLGLACFMIPITVAFALVGMVFLNSYSARFKSFGDSVISLMVFGYLKPNDLKPIMEKGEAVSFLRIYHIGYLVVAIFAIVNFIVAVISDADSKARKCLRPADQLQYVLTMMKLKSEELTAESRKQKKYDDFISAARAAMIYNKPLSSDRRLTDILS